MLRNKCPFILNQTNWNILFTSTLKLKTREKLWRKKIPGIFSRYVTTTTTTLSSPAARLKLLSKLIYVWRTPNLQSLSLSLTLFFTFSLSYLWQALHCSVFLRLNKEREIVRSKREWERKKERDRVECRLKVRAI